MKIRLKNNYNLLLPSIFYKNRVTSLYITGCSKINAYNIADSIISSDSNILERIRIDIGTLDGSYENLMRFSGLHGLKDNGESQDKPVLIGTYRIPQWILESEKNRIESTFSSELTLGYSGIAYDSGFDYVHFIETTVPTLNSTHFNLNDYTKIYVGTGNSYYEDYMLLQRYLETPFWAGYAEKLDTWFNYIAKSSVPSDYEVQEYIQSDNVNTILPSLSFTNDSRFTIDCSFTYMEESGQAVQGNINSGLKGDKTNGLIFSFSNHTETLQAQDEWIDDTERLYDISIKENTIKLNGVTLYAGANGSVESGEVTLFSGFVGRIWGLKFYNNSQLVSNLIPVYKKSTYQVGLYDIISGNFYIGVGYSSSNINRGILTENGDAVLLEEGFDYLKIDNTTNNSKISELQEITNNLSNFYTLGIKNGSNKRYNLGTTETEILKASNACGLRNFDPDIEYSKGDFVKYGKYAYKFLENHTGAWIGSDTVLTSGIEELMSLSGAETNQATTIHFTIEEDLELEYIESSGTQWVSTGINGENNNLSFEFKYMYQNWTSYGYLFGNYYSANYNTTRLILGQTDDNSALFNINTKASGGTMTISNLNTPNIIHTVELNRGSAVFDGSSITGGSTTSGTANSYNIVLFGNNNRGTVTATGINARIYYFKIYDNGVLVRDFIPLKRRDSVGLLDRVSGEFYTNSGTGNLIAGPLKEGVTNPIAGKQVTLKIYESNELYQTKTLTINSEGNIETNIPRDLQYSIIPQKIEGYKCNFDILNSYSDRLTKTHSLYYSKSKNSDRNLTINFKINGSSAGSELNTKIMYIYFYYNDIVSTSGYLQFFEDITINGNSVKVNNKSYNKNLKCKILFPDLSGYNKPSNDTFTIEGNELIIDANYTTA